MKSRFEPFWWSLFGAGGAISALFLPVLLFFFGLAIPLGWVAPPSYEALSGLVEPVISRLLLFALISLSLFHWAHRFRFTLHEGLQLQHWHRLIAFLCYGSAVVLTLLAAYFLGSY